MKPAKSVEVQIAEVEKRRVTLALELQRTNRQREDLRQKITKAGWNGFFSTDGADLLGLGDVHDKVEWAAARLVVDGILTRVEIEDIRAGRQIERGPHAVYSEEPSPTPHQNRQAQNQPG